MLVCLTGLGIFETATVIPGIIGLVEEQYCQLIQCPKIKAEIHKRVVDIHCISLPIFPFTDEDIGPLFLDVQPYLDHQNGSRESSPWDKVVCAGCCHRTISQVRLGGE